MKVFDSILNMGRKLSATEPATHSLTAEPAAVPTTATERDEVLAIIQKFFSPRQTGPATWEIDPAPGVPADAIRALLASVATARPPLTDEQRAKLVVLMTERDDLLRELNKYSHTAVRSAHDAHLAEIGEAVISGNAATPDAFSKEDFASDFSQRRQALKTAAGERAAAAAEIFAAVAETLHESLRSAAEEVLIAEYRLCARFGVSYQPSLLARIAMAAPSFLRRQADKALRSAGVGMGICPRTLFQLVAIDL